MILFIKNGARWLLFDVLSFNVIKSIISSEKFFKNNFVTICNSFRKSFLDDNESSEWISNLKKTQPKDFNNDSEIYILLNDDFSDVLNPLNDDDDIEDWMKPLLFDQFFDHELQQNFLNLTLFIDENSFFLKIK